MADEDTETDEDRDEDAEGEDGEGEGKKKLGLKKLILFVGVPVLVLIIGGGAAAFFLLKPSPDAEGAEGEDADKDKKEKEKKEKKKKDKGKDGEPGALVMKEGPDGIMFVTMPDILVNIQSNDGRPTFLKLKLTLEAPNEDVAYALEPILPRVSDLFMSFLRELRTDDLAGSEGSLRLRMELLRRVNLALEDEGKVNAVLIEEMLVQ